MMKVTTAQILADKALNQPCGTTCVDWAISMLEEGRDGDYLTRLAGMLPPYNHFELADLRDRTLREQGIPDLDRSAAVHAFAAERLRLALAGDVELITALEAVKDLCIAQDYVKELYDFYLLYWAYRDLCGSDVQWYWHGATRANIDSLIRQRARAFHTRDDRRILAGTTVEPSPRGERMLTERLRFCCTRGRDSVARMFRTHSSCAPR